MELIELGTTPISDDAPTGEDPRYEPEYEEMQTEVEKLQSVTSTEEVDWNKVQNLCTTILSEKAKEVLCTCYLGAALIELEGMEGLAKGSNVLKEIIEHFWEKMFPALKRMRGRKNAVEWYYGRVEEFLQNYSGDPVPKELSEQISSTFDSIDGFLAEKMDDPPFARNLINAIQMIPIAEDETASEPAQALPETAQQTTQPESKPATSTPSPASMPQAPDIDAPSSKTDVTHAVNDILSQLKKVTAFFFKNDLSNPMLYSITRTCAWLPLAGLPPAEQGQTKIPPPPDQVEQVLVDLQQKGEWESLVKAAEAKVTQFLFWLDLDFLVYDALDHMGSNYQAARDTVARHTASLLDQLPGIETYSFADGKPFAKEETRNWLATIAASESSAAGMGGMSAGAGADQDKISSAYQDAMDLAKDKKLADAIQILRVPLSQASSGASKMNWRLALIRLLLFKKKPDIAASLAEESLSKIESHKLATWDPMLALEGYLLSFSVFSALKDDHYHQLAAECFKQISRLDPAQALRLKV